MLEMNKRVSKLLRSVYRLQICPSQECHVLPFLRKIFIISVLKKQ